jgi:hypothetical protein
MVGEVSEPRGTQGRRGALVASALLAIALVSDWGTPAAAWAAIVPAGCVVTLLVLRRWRFAIMGIVLSSWVAIPTVGGLVYVRDLVRGRQRLYGVVGLGLIMPRIDFPDFKRCYSDEVDLRVLQVGHFFRWPHERIWAEVAWSFASTHNAIVLWDANRRGQPCTSTSELVPETPPPNKPLRTDEHLGRFARSIGR